MRFEVRQRDRRALLILGAALVAYLGLTEIGLPVYDRLRLASNVAGEKEEQLQKYRRALNRKGRYTQLVPAARQQVVTAEEVLIKGDNASLAAAELQSLVEEITRNSEVSVSQRSVSELRKIDESYSELAMSLAFEATPGQALNFLTGVRMAPKFLTVKTMQIAPAQALTEAPKSGEYRKTMRVNVTIAAILRPAKVD